MSDAISGDEQTYCDVCFEDALEDIKKDGLRAFEEIKPEELEDEDYLIERRLKK